MRRVNLLRAHGSPTRYLYQVHGCRCVACRAARSKHYSKYYAEHRAEILEHARQYNAEHREEKAEYNRKYAAAHPETKRRRHIRNTYGINIEAWEELLANQGGRCACCGSDDPGGKTGWHTDHDHETGTVRGILCGCCNKGLGHFHDDPKRLWAGIQYLTAATA